MIESKRWDVLKFKLKNYSEDYVKVYAQYNEMVKLNSNDLRLQQLADRVIRYELLAKDAEDKTINFYKYLKAKYSTASSSYAPR
jgi:hypothetical protein